MQCKICGETDEGKFYTSIRTYCKEHWKARARRNREKRIEYYRAYDRLRSKTEDRKQHISRNTKRQRSANPEKYKARTAVSNALRDGRLTREPCVFCLCEETQAHHVDYSKPLDVIWVCSTCHHRLHVYEAKVKSIMVGDAMARKNKR